VRLSPIILAFLIGLLAGAGSPAQPQPAREAGISLHAHAFLDPERRPTVLVSIEIPYASLIFLKKGGAFQSDYSVIVKVLDGKKKIVETAVLTESVVSDEYEATRSVRMSSRLSRRFHLPQGEYVIGCLVQVKDTQRTFEKQVAVTVPEFLEAGIGVGEPRLYTARIDTSAAVFAEVGDMRDLDERELESPFFASLDRHLIVRFDVYSEEEAGGTTDCDLYYEVLDERKDVRAYGKARATITGLRSQFAVYLDVDEWDPGRHVFFAKAVQLQPVREVTTSLSFVLAYTRAMLTKHFDRTIALLSLIASEDEIAALKNASEADRPAFWASFWARRDPSPGTEENEALEEHLRRVRHAIENFADTSVGWESDRGRVYIKYGEPDHTELQIDPQYQGEYLIWYYYEENVRFVFYDRFGLGEYRLTGTGEI
jgi:GWxTD domain-containing protein